MVSTPSAIRERITALAPVMGCRGALATGVGSSTGLAFIGNTSFCCIFYKFCVFKSYTVRCFPSGLLPLRPAGGQLFRAYFHVVLVAHRIYLFHGVTFSQVNGAASKSFGGNMP